MATSKTLSMSADAGGFAKSTAQLSDFPSQISKDDNVWALFVHPDFENKGIGRMLHDTMLDWYFENDKDQIWLGTAPGTRAERFYRIAGWRENGMHRDEIKFEMTKFDWKTRKRKP